MAASHDSQTMPGRQAFRLRELTAKGKSMRQVKRVPEDPELFEQLLLTRAVAVIAGQPERIQLPSRERVLTLLTDDEIKTAIENAAYCAGEFVRRVKENGDSPMLADASGYGQAADIIQVAVNEWQELYFGGPR
jgi:hypothetical protein